MQRLADATTPRSLHDAPQAETGRPVVLLHGFASTPSVMRPLSRHLRGQLGRETVSLPVSSTRDLRAQAVAVMRAVRELAVRSGGPVDIVAHSMGGLIATYALKVLDRGRHIGSVVTLGTPHRGSPLALVGAVLRGEMSSVLFQMRPGAEFLAEIDAHEVPTTSRLVSVVGTRDIVVPAESSRIAPCERQRTLWVSGASHSSLLINRAAFRLVGEALRRAVEAPVEAWAA